MSDTFCSIIIKAFNAHSQFITLNDIGVENAAKKWCMLINSSQLRANFNIVEQEKIGTLYLECYLYEVYQTMYS